MFELKRDVKLNNSWMKVVDCNFSVSGFGIESDGKLFTVHLISTDLYKCNEYCDNIERDSYLNNVGIMATDVETLEHYVAELLETKRTRSSNGRAPG